MREIPTFGPPLPFQEIGYWLWGGMVGTTPRALWIYSPAGTMVLVTKTPEAIARRQWEELGYDGVPGPARPLAPHERPAWSPAPDQWWRSAKFHADRTEVPRADLLESSDTGRQGGPPRARVAREGAYEPNIVPADLSWTKGSFMRPIRPYLFHGLRLPRRLLAPGGEDDDVWEIWCWGGGEDHPVVAQRFRGPLVPVMARAGAWLKPWFSPFSAKHPDEPLPPRDLVPSLDDPVWDRAARAHLRTIGEADAR